jgi:hypothetical protein
MPSCFKTAVRVEVECPGKQLFRFNRPGNQRIYTEGVYTLVFFRFEEFIPAQGFGMTPQIGAGIGKRLSEMVV